MALLSIKLDQISKREPFTIFFYEQQTLSYVPVWLAGSADSSRCRTHKSNAYHEQVLLL